MNSNPSTETSSAHPSSETISRRAYELWEQEGRPEGNDMRHWFQAEQELAGRNGRNGAEREVSPQAQQARQQASDARPLQGTRAGAAANRDSKRTSNSPFPSDRTASNSASGKLEGAGRRRA